jgi:hypothetical protein
MQVSSSASHDTRIITDEILSRPIKAYWTFMPDDAQHCINEGANFVAASAINMLTDVLVVASPMPIVWKLHLPKKTRLAVIYLFSLGFLVCVVGAVRIYFTVRVTMSIHRHDITWEALGMWITGLVELDLAIVSYICIFHLPFY